MKKIMTLLLITILAGCTTQTSTQDNNTQIANPASVYCVEQGYTLELRNETGYCVFSDGSECEEWAYYRGECIIENITVSDNITSINTLDIISDIDNALDEVNKIDVNDTGDVIIPLTESDLNTE